MEVGSGVGIGVAVGYREGVGSGVGVAVGKLEGVGTGVGVGSVCEDWAAVGWDNDCGGGDASEQAVSRTARTKTAVVAKRIGVCKLEPPRGAGWWQLAKDTTTHEMEPQGGT